jgi:D-Tyr-tRNAtyr deacylase
VDKMINKLLAYRVFADEQGKMNLSVAEYENSAIEENEVIIAQSKVILSLLSSVVIHLKV